MLSFRNPLEKLLPIRYAMKVISTEGSPRQIAAAVALGACIGLLPKGNLLAVGLTIAMFTVRVNLGIGLLTAFTVSLFHGTLLPLTHGIGVRAFQNPSVYRWIESIYEWPLVPWTSLNNTVVLGSSLLAAALAYPIYHVSLMVVTAAEPHYRAAYQKLRKTQSEEQIPAHEAANADPPMDVVDVQVRGSEPAGSKSTRIEPEFKPPLPVPTETTSIPKEEPASRDRPRRDSVRPRRSAAPSNFPVSRLDTREAAGAYRAWEPDEEKESDPPSQSAGDPEDAPGFALESPAHGAGATPDVASGRRPFPADLDFGKGSSDTRGGRVTHALEKGFGIGTSTPKRSRVLFVQLPEAADTPFDAADPNHDDNDMAGDASSSDEERKNMDSTQAVDRWSDCA